MRYRKVELATKWDQTASSQSANDYTSEGSDDNPVERGEIYFNLKSKSLIEIINVNSSLNNVINES